MSIRSNFQARQLTRGFFGMGHCRIHCFLGIKAVGFYAGAVSGGIMEQGPITQATTDLSK
jgi:hypothetical protein